jgi:hypothetical protein
LGKILKTSSEGWITVVFLMLIRVKNRTGFLLRVLKRITVMSEEMLHHSCVVVGEQLECNSASLQPKEKCVTKTPSSYTRVVSSKVCSLELRFNDMFYDKRVKLV